MFPTPNKAQTMKTDRPAGVLGVKSPYPTVLNASKPKREHKVYKWRGTREEMHRNVQNHAAMPKDQPSVLMKMTEPI